MHASSSSSETTARTPALGFRRALANGWHHFLTITRHKALVMRHCFCVGLYKQGLLHDLSKYSPSEFMTGVRFYTGTHSPNAESRRQTGISRAWLHHKGRNKHNFERTKMRSSKRLKTPRPAVFSFSSRTSSG